MAEDAVVLARALFESALAVFWILKTASRRRAQMYIAHVSMRDRKMFQEWKRTKGLKRYATARIMRTVEARIEESAKILKRENMKGLAERYSGKSIKDTAKAVGLLITYQIFYRHASGFGHGSDLLSHMSYSPDAPVDWFMNLLLPDKTTAKLFFRKMSLCDNALARAFFWPNKRSR